MIKKGKTRQKQVTKAEKENESKNEASEELKITDFSPPKVVNQASQVREIIHVDQQGIISRRSITDVSHLQEEESKQEAKPTKKKQTRARSRRNK